MLENKFFLLVVNFVWMAGLLGMLFALLSMLQPRHAQWWRGWGLVRTPRTMALLYGTMGLFVSGLALYVYTKAAVVGTAMSVSMAMIWALLALFLCYECMELLLDGVDAGWETSLDDDDEVDTPAGAFPLSSMLLLLLVVTNGCLLSWWVTKQVNAGTLNFSALTTFTSGAALSVPEAAAYSPTSSPLDTAAAGGPVGAHALGPTASISVGTPSLLTTVLPTAPTGLAATATPPVLRAAGSPPTTTLTLLLRTALPKSGAMTEPVTASITPPVAVMVTPTDLLTTTIATTPTLKLTLSLAPVPLSTATATRQPTPTPQPLPTLTTSTGVVQPLKPADNTSSHNQIVFAWDATFIPSADFAFELIFWKAGQDPLGQGFGVAAPTVTKQVSVDLQRLDNTLGTLLEPGTYQWGVLLVRTTPSYERIDYLGGGRNVIYIR